MISTNKAAFEFDKAAGTGGASISFVENRKSLMRIPPFLCDKDAGTDCGVIWSADF
jgi:hypothetical protein